MDFTHQRIYSGTVLALGLSVISIMLGFGLFGPFLPLYAELLGATLGIQIGVMTSAFMLVRAITAKRFGELSDRIGRKKVIVAGILTYAAGTLILPLAQDWTHLVVLRGVQGAGGGMFWPVAVALIGDAVPPGSRGRALGFFYTCSTLGLIFGPALGGFIQVYSQNNLGASLLDSFRIPFYFGGILTVISALLALKMVKETQKPTATGEAVPRTGVHERFRPTFRSLALLNFSNGFSFSFMTPIIVFYTQHEYGLTISETSLYMSAAFFVQGLVMAVTQSLAGSMADRGERKRMILIGLSAGNAMTFLMPLSPGVLWILILMAARSAVVALSQPPMISMLEDIIPRGVRGKLSGVTESAWTMGAILGPVVGFLLYDNLSRASPFFVAALLSSVTLIHFFVRATEPSREEAEI